MSIWNDPEITFEEFGKYLCDDSNKSTLQKIWNEKTKNKQLLSELAAHELSDILIEGMKECIKSFNKSSSPNSEQLQDSSHLFSDWIVENKLSGIPSSDQEDYNTMKLQDIFDQKILFQWISESSIPLKSYIESKNQHNPTLSQQQIAAKNKRIIAKHPSLAHLFQQKIVNKNQNEFNTFNEKTKHKETEKYNMKQQELDQNVHHLRKSRALLFFNHSDVGYETKTKCKLYKDEKLTSFLIEVEKGELIGGKKENKQTKVIQIIEPIQGYIASKYVTSFDLNNSQWKFLQHQRSMTSQSLILRLNNNDLLLPQQEEEKNDDYKEEEMQNAPDLNINDKTKKKTVKFSGAYNENEDEKKLEANPTSYNDPVIMKDSNISLTEKRLRKCKENIAPILNIKTSKRTPQQVLDLWTAGFNLHNLSILKKCYSPQVTSQQFVNQELNARDPILQCLKQMFEASNDVGLEVTNCILKDGSVILEFRTFGTKKKDRFGSPTNSMSDKQENDGKSEHFLASHPTKQGLPQRVVNGVGIFQVNNGQITAQKLFWDQDQQWFSDMNVIKMPSSSTLNQLLYKNNYKLAPILNLSDEHLESGSSNGSSEHIELHQMQQTLHGEGADDDVIYQMNDEMNEILALRGLNMTDLQQYNQRSRNTKQSKQKQVAQAMFWIAVGAMFVFIVPKYLGKPRR